MAGSTYDPSFSAPNFAPSFYLFSGPDVNIDTSKIWFDDGTARYWEGYNHRAFGTTFQTTFTLDRATDGEYNSTFYHMLKRASYTDFIQVEVEIQTYVGTWAWVTFKFVTSAGGVLGTHQYLTPGNSSGPITVGITINPDPDPNSIGTSKVVPVYMWFQWEDVLGPGPGVGHSLSYDVSREWDWSARCVAPNEPAAITEVTAQSLETGLRTNLYSIPPSEAWGIPSLTSSVGPLTVQPYSIPSSEAWGFVLVRQGQIVSPTSILSSELWGIPTIILGGRVDSLLPPPEPIAEGDIYLGLVARDGYVDPLLGDRDVVRDPAFETSVLITLASDKRADVDDELPDDSGYKGGWWGDNTAEVENDRIGWKGWLLQRSKTTQEAIAACEEYLQDGFRWMFDDGIVESMHFTVSRARINNQHLDETLYMRLQFVKPGGQDIYYSFYYNWQAQLLRRA